MHKLVVALQPSIWVYAAVLPTTQQFPVKIKRFSISKGTLVDLSNQHFCETGDAGKQVEADRGVR